jgi:hypothetical protein
VKHYLLVTISLILLSATVLVSATDAHADSLSAFGGLGFGRNSGMNYLNNPSPSLGLHYTFDLSNRIQLGGFYNYNMMTDGDGVSASVKFMGGILRFQTERGANSGPFVDVKFGMAQKTEKESNSRNMFTYGTAIGYAIPLSHVTSLSPTVNLDFLPSTPDGSATRQAYTSAGLTLSFKLH